MWPVLMGEVPPYSGPRTPDGRVRSLLGNLQYEQIFKGIQMHDMVVPLKIGALLHRYSSLG